MLKTTNNYNVTRVVLILGGKSQIQYLKVGIYILYRYMGTDLSVSKRELDFTYIINEKLFAIFWWHYNI